MAVDSSGNVHVAWADLTDYGGAGTDQDIFYRRFEFALPAEPASLRDLVEFPGAVHLRDLYEATYPPDWETLTKTEVVSTVSTGDSLYPSLAVDSSGNVHVAWVDSTDYGGSGTDPGIFYRRSGPDKIWTLTEMMSIVEGLAEMKAHFESKGFLFELAASNVSIVDGGLYSNAFSGSVLSWWSNPNPNGIHALLVAAMMDDGKNMVFGAITNLLPPELIPEVDPYIIVNAMPYMYVQWFFYDTLNDRIVTWSYWWYDSHSHPNWFWNVYWKWRNYINEYHGWHTYLPWWWWLWHYTYDKHWHNWSAEFPY